MKNSKETRTCLGCKTKKNKKELIRITKGDEGIVIDLNQKIKARGAYVCNNIECFEKMKKTRGLERTFKIKVTEKQYNELQDGIIGSIYNKIKYDEYCGGDLL